MQDEVIVFRSRPANAGRLRRHGPLLDPPREHWPFGLGFYKHRDEPHSTMGQVLQKSHNEDHDAGPRALMDRGEGV